MRRVVLAALLFVSVICLVPATAFLTARNAAVGCGQGEFAFGGARPVAVAPAGTTFEARIASWNTEAANSTAAVVDGLRSIGSRADIVGLQELHPESRRKAVARAFGNDWGISEADNAVQIMWRTSRYERLSEGSEKVFDVENIENGIAGTSIGPKSIQWVQLRDRSTRAIILVANHHIVPTIDHNGHPDTSNPKRLALADRQLTAMTKLIDALRAYGPVFTTGDLNVDERMDARVRDSTFPFVRMGTVGMVSNWEALRYPEGGTHSGRRLIDSVWTTAATAHFVDQDILATYGSDHNAVVATARSGPGAVPVPAAAAVFGNQAGQLIPTGSVPDRLTVPGSASGSIELSGEQVKIAAAIVRIGKANAIPEQGWVVAIAAALQESRLRNLDYGDRDSLGVFQQRPSSGWGTPAQIRDVDLSIRAFYGVADHTHNRGLTDIDGWQAMTVTRAAQAVQGSGFPNAYAQWENAARSTVEQLAGTPDISSPCSPEAPAIGNCPQTELPAEKGLTPDALLVIRCGHQQFPMITSFGAVRPDALPDHPSGRAIDFMIPDYRSPEGNAFGWQVAHWMREHHDELGVQYVIFDAKIWNVLRDAEGWRPYGSVTGHDDDSSLHRNHVHVTVWGNKAIGPGSIDPAQDSFTWVMPLPAGSYTVGCAFGCYRGHTGQDFPVAVRTPVVSSNAGTVIRSEALRDRHGNYRSFGNLIVIRDAKDPSLTIWYGHLSARIVGVGERVTAGQLIASSGDTGHASGPHLHYEIRVGRSPVDPVPVLQAHHVVPQS